MSRIETLIGEAILQDAQPVEIKGVGTLQVAHPSTATIIEVSKTIGNLPQLPTIRGKEEQALQLLATALLEEYTPEQLEEIITTCLGLQQIGFFLNITTTLNEANLLRQTKNGTTASGQ